MLLKEHDSNEKGKIHVQSSMPKSVARATVDLGTGPVECHVLNDGRRVLSTVQVQETLGAAKDRKFRRSLDRIHNISKELTLRPTISFSVHDGAIAYAYEASFVMDVCLAYQAAFLANLLHPSQMKIARRAMAIVTACAKVGIDALIDEATGYQKDRQGDYLSQRLERFLRDQKDTWRVRWQRDLVSAFCRLYGKPIIDGLNPKFMQGVEGRIYDIVIGHDVMRELRRRNPNPRKGSNHHQFFDHIIQELLEDDLRVIHVMAETSTSKVQFWNRMLAHYRKAPLQSEIFQ